MEKCPKCNQLLTIEIDESVSIHEDSSIHINVIEIMKWIACSFVWRRIYEQF